jgi:RHS repeat-associated protein
MKMRRKMRVNYYPFGLTMSGISTTAPLKLENNYKFQGKELQHKEFGDGTGPGTYQFKYRMDDPQTGGFWQIDPLADKYVYNSPYAFSEDKVTRDIELEGLETKS